MSYGYYKNVQNNLIKEQNFNNYHFQNLGKPNNFRLNYHYRQKEKEQAKEIKINNQNNNKNSINQFFINNNDLNKEEENKKNLNFYENKKENQYNHRNRSYHANNLSKGHNFQTNFFNENKRVQKAKELMDNFDKKLYDTISNFSQGNKLKNNEETKTAEKIDSINDQRNINTKRNYSYNKYNYNKNENENSTLRNTDYLYKNYFQNTFENNIHRINANEFINNDNYNNYNKIYQKDYYKTNNIFRRVNYKIKDFSYFSLAGTDSLKHPKINQDSFLTKEDKGNFIFGVFDGHGIEGHLISQSIKNFLNTNANTNSFSTKDKILSLFNNLSSNINSSTSFKAMESGSTAILVFIDDDKIISANCGDSRALLISEIENKIIPLSRDHKPEIPEERKRIIMSGGRVDRIFGMGPYRVFFKDADYPGLAMSRSIGDGYAHKIGVIDEPEILEFNLNNIRPKAIILASDGVFEFVKNEEIKDIIEKYYYKMDSKGCAKEIVDYSRKIWENSGYAIDDITCIVGFFGSA